MIRKLSIAVLATAALAGCVTDGYSYRGGSGDYYYGRPSVDYDYYGGYGGYGGYGYPGGWYGGYDYRHGYGYGYPYYGYYGGYWDYPYYYPPYRPRPPHHPRPPRPDDDHGPRTGGTLPPSRADGGPQGGQLARPRLTQGVYPPVRRDPSGGMRPGVGEPRPGGRGEAMRVRSPATSAPLAPRPVVVPAPRAQSQPSAPVRSLGREPVSRPPASRERDMGQKVER